MIFQLCLRPRHRIQDSWFHLVAPATPHFIHHWGEAAHHVDPKESLLYVDPSRQLLLIGRGS